MRSYVPLFESTAEASILQQRMLTTGEKYKTRLASDLVTAAENSAATQRSITKTSYEKSARMLLDLLPSGATVLDYGAGLMEGTSILKKVLQDKATVLNYEPFPAKGIERGNPPPHFSKLDASDITAEMDAVVCLNVLNVLQPEVRDQVVRKIGSVMKSGGVAIISSRPWKKDIMATTQTVFGYKVVGGSDELDSRFQVREDQALYTYSGGDITYQKGIDPGDLVAYVSGLLPDCDVVRANVGSSSVLVTKH